MDDQTTSLIPLIYEAVEKPDKWYVILEAICRITGADKAVLSLRDRMTARLILPSVVGESFESPMLYNIEENYVQSFLDKYIEFDPWSPIENRYHPFHPYALSSYLPHEELVASKFWEWLEPQGVSDTVVAEIGMMPKHWIAINIFFAHDQEGTRDRVLNVMEELLPLLRKVWQAGEVIREGVLAVDRARYFLENHREAAVLLLHDGTMVAVNQKASQLKGCPFTFFGNRMGYRSTEIRKKFEAAMAQLGDKPNQPQYMELSIEGYTTSLSLMGPVEDSLGMDKATRLLTLNRQKDGSEFLKRPIWDNPLLTPAEKELVYHLAHGGKVSDFGKIAGLSPHGADNRWRGVKKKLDVEHPREIYAIHRIYNSLHHD